MQPAQTVRWRPMVLLGKAFDVTVVALYIYPLCWKLWQSIRSILNQRFNLVALVVMSVTQRLYFYG